MEWSSYLSRGAPPMKKMLIGGNWYDKYNLFPNVAFIKLFHDVAECRKCNGTISEMKKIINHINNCGEIPLQSEVCIKYNFFLIE